MRCLAFDVETRPHVCYTWGLWDQTVAINQIEEPGAVICWSGKWIGENGVHFSSDFHDDHETMVRECWKMFDSADVIVHYNGRKFDIPWMNSEFAALKLPPPAPFRQIDLYSAVKKQFRFPSYKLAYVSQALHIGRKVKHEGFELWKRCMAGEPAAWERMKTYNKRDVLLVEKLYYRLLPWIPNIPSRSVELGPNEKGKPACPACGQYRLQSRGSAFTQQSQYPRYQCTACGKWSRGTKRESGVSIREVAV